MPSTIVVQVGTEGNTVGEHLWQSALNEVEARRTRAHACGWKATDNSALTYGMDAMFEQLPSPAGVRTVSSLRARAILADSTPDTVHGLMNGPCASVWSQHSVACGTYGHMASWAEAYNGSVAAEWPEAHDCSVSATVLRRLNWEMGLQKSSCSTESVKQRGLGSRVLESVRAVHPRMSVAVAAVAPDARSLLQPSASEAANVTLAAQWAQSYADCCMLLRADDHSFLNSPRPGRGRQDAASSATAHAHMGRTLAGLVLPRDPGPPVAKTSADDVARSLGRGGAAATGALATRSLTREMIHAVCPDPGLKFVELYGAAHPAAQGTLRQRPGRQSSAAGEVEAWQAAADALVQSIAASRKSERATSSASLAVLRGAIDARLAADVEAAVAESLARSVSHAAWNRKPVGCVLAGPLLSGEALRHGGAAAAPAASLDADNLLVVAMNRRSCGSFLGSAAAGAEALTQDQRWMEHFHQFGCPRDALMNAAASCHDIASAYQYAHG